MYFVQCIPWTHTMYTVRTTQILQRLTQHTHTYIPHAFVHSNIPTHAYISPFICTVYIQTYIRIPTHKYISPLICTLYIQTNIYIGTCHHTNGYIYTNMLKTSLIFTYLHACIHDVCHTYTVHRTYIHSYTQIYISNTIYNQSVRTSYTVRRILYCMCKYIRSMYGVHCVCQTMYGYIYTYLAIS